MTDILDFGERARADGRGFTAQLPPDCCDDCVRRWCGDLPGPADWLAIDTERAVAEVRQRAGVGVPHGLEGEL